MLEIMKKTVKLLEEGRRGVLATLVRTEGSTPRKLGARLLVGDDGSLTGTIGGGALEHRVRRRAAEVLDTGSAELIEADLEEDLGMQCGGKAWVLLEPLTPSDRLVILGGGHIGLELCEMGARCGLQVWVLDGREGFVTEERFPRATRRLDRLEPETVVEDAELLGPPLRQTYVVIVTHNHALDHALAEKIAPLEDLRYLGVIGSRRKSAELKEKLRENGVESHLVDRVRSPVGLPLGGKSPGEISLSILSEIQSERRGSRKKLREAL
jgi:xanthine dehydrogenase accessory factor